MTISGKTVRNTALLLACSLAGACSTNLHGMRIPTHPNTDTPTATA